jgi:hypothetical protein
MHSACDAELFYGSLFRAGTWDYQGIVRFMSWMEFGVSLASIKYMSRCRGFESDFIQFWLLLLYFAQSIYP